MTYTDQDKASSLGPSWGLSARIVESMLEKMKDEDLKPVLDRAVQAFSDKLWDDMRLSILDSAESNVAANIHDMVDQTIMALLTGEEWAMKLYPFADYGNGEAVRKAVAKHGSDPLLLARIADLEKEVAQLKETIAWLRR